MKILFLQIDIAITHYLLLNNTENKHRIYILMYHKHFTRIRSRPEKIKVR